MTTGRRHFQRGGDSLRNSTVNAAAGVIVTYQVLEIPDLSSPNVATNVGPVAVPGTPVPLPLDDAASRFFKVKVMIELP